MVHLAPRELAALRLLIDNAGQIVSPLQLKHALWSDVHVTADSVPKCLSSLRARLAPEACIQTVYKRGYRFLAEVRREGSPQPVALRLAIPPLATGYSVPEHLGAAIAEDTIARLSNMRPPNLAVLARDSIFALARRGLTALQIGRELGADLVLSGTLSAVAQSFRVRTEMIRVEDGIQIWVEDMLVDPFRVVGLEAELVERLAFRLISGIPGDGSSSLRWLGAGKDSDAPQMSSASDRDEPGASPGSWQNGALSISAAAEREVQDQSAVRKREAYEMFLRGRHEWHTLARHRMQDGLRHLMRATELDPSLIAAKVDLVHLCVTQSFYGFMSPAVAAEQMRRIAHSIPDFPHRAEAMLPAMGWVSFHFDHDLSAAIQAFTLSAHLPHEQWVTRMRVMLALGRHRFDEAIALLRAAIQADPFSAWLQSRLAWALHLDGQATESVNEVLHGLSHFPDHEGTSLYGAMILVFNGQTERGAALAKTLAHRSPDLDLATAVHAYALACSGLRNEACAILERLQWLSRERFVLRSFTPAAYVALGDHQNALAELRAAEEARCPWFFQMLADPRLKPLGGQPEFERMRDLLAQIEAEAARSLDGEG
ncbi:MAG: winged helix-turn-helix domain-containing protein [Terracidiphilus sp.]